MKQLKLSDLNPKGFPVNLEQEANLKDLLYKLNTLIADCPLNLSWKVTSGLRSIEDHKRIYVEKAKRDKKDITTIRIPMGSMHLKGAAVDIYDGSGELYRWLKKNPEILEKADLYCEDETKEPRVHFQCLAPRSGNRWYYP